MKTMKEREGREMNREKVMEGLKRIGEHAETLMKVPSCEQHIASIQSVISVALLEIKGCMDGMVGEGESPAGMDPWYEGVKVKEGGREAYEEYFGGEKSRATGMDGKERFKGKVEGLIDVLDGMSRAGQADMEGAGGDDFVEAEAIYVECEKGADALRRLLRKLGG